MPQYIKPEILSRPVVSPIETHLRVGISSGSFVVADETAKCVGCATGTVDLSGSETAVLRSAPRLTFIASEQINAGVEVFAAAGGKVATSGDILEGIALTNASGDGVPFEAVPA